MIIIELKGGLGNQMFQYAFAYNLSKKILYSDEFNITNRLGLIDHSIISGTINYLYWKNIKNNILTFTSKDPQ